MTWRCPVTARSAEDKKKKIGNPCYRVLTNILKIFLQSNHEYNYFL